MRPVSHSPVSRPVLLVGLLLLLTLSVTLPAAAQDDILEQARQSYMRLDDEQALAQVNEYLVGDPLHVNASDLRARCLMYLGRFPDAVQTLTRLKDPPMRVRLLLAEVTALAGDPKKGLAIVDEIMLEDPSASIPRVARAKILLKAGQFQRARLELSQILATEPKNAEAVITMGMAAEGLKIYQEAVSQYMSYLEAPGTFLSHDPHLQKYAAEGTARCFEMMGMFDRSLNWYQQLAERFPDNAWYHFRLGIALGMRNRLADAITSMEKAVELQPTDILVRARLGDLYQSNQQTDKAIEQYETILINCEDPRLPTLRLTELYLESGELDKAVVHRDAIEHLDPENPRALELIGRVCEKTGQPDKAKASYRKAFALNPLQYQSIYRLGLLLSSSGDPAQEVEGKALLERYQRVAPYLADLEQARNQARVNPTSVPVMIQIAAITNQAQEYETAATWAQRARQAQPGNPQVLALSGCIAANTGKTQDALDFFKQAQQALVALGQQPTETLKGYIDTIESGGTLPLPLGEITRPTTEDPAHSEHDGHDHGEEDGAGG